MKPLLNTSFEHETSQCRIGTVIGSLEVYKDHIELDRMTEFRVLHRGRFYCVKRVAAVIVEENGAETPLIFLETGDDDGPFEDLPFAGEEVTQYVVVGPAKGQP